ncbi:MAG: glutaredoxin domain-containing protein [Halothiobacillaceae bacterium]
MPQADATVYIRRACFYCAMAQRLLNTKGVKFTPVVVDGAALWGEMVEHSGRSSLPQVIMDDRPIGGHTDLLALDREGVLDDLPFPTRWPGSPMKEVDSSSNNRVQ